MKVTTEIKEYNEPNRSFCEMLREHLGELVKFSVHGSNYCRIYKVILIYEDCYDTDLDRIGLIEIYDSRDITRFGDLTEICAEDEYWSHDGVFSKFAGTIKLEISQ